MAVRVVLSGKDVFVYQPDWLWREFSPTLLATEHLVSPLRPTESLDLLPPGDVIDSWFFRPPSTF